MIDEIRQKYAAVKAYEQAHGHDSRLSNIWLDNMPLIQAMLREAKNAEHLIDMVDRTFLYSINYPPELSAHTGTFWQQDAPDKPEIREKAIRWLKERYRLDVVSRESPFIHRRNLVDGESVNFLRTLFIKKEIVGHGLWKIVGCSLWRSHILELGAGAGHLARTLISLVPLRKYTIIDLPETLCFSYAHLRLCFPDLSALFVSSPEDMDRIDDFDLVFIPTVFSPALAGRNYGLFINVASLGEMPNETIRHWMDFIQNKIRVENLFTLNRFLNTVTPNIAERRAGQNECSVLYDNRWNIRWWEVEPEYTRCPWIDTAHNRYVQICASRIEQPSNAEQLSRELYEDAISEDWYRMRHYYGGGLTMAGDQRLVNDMGMSGTTFKLWESIRLHPTRDNVSAMILWLSRLGRPLPFEEVAYYERLLMSMPGTNTLTMGQ